MYKLKDVARRGTSLAAAVALMSGIGASALPGIASADALNPLTERSLTLSSSSPGWSYTDGSGNSTYAPPNSGANGQKTGNSFSFRVSSGSQTIKAVTFQYCTTPAGTCMAPGDNVVGGSGPASFTRAGDSTTTTDLNVVTTSPTEISKSAWDNTIDPAATVSPRASHTPLANDSEGNFVVLHGSTSTLSYSGTLGDWAMTKANAETGDVAHNTGTGANNKIMITSTTGQAISSGDYFKIIFFGTDGNYITNPGSGAFFVRINTYNSAATQDGTTLVDGGVTVANVMNESIQIQTKVLETMAFSVGTHDPDMYTATAGSNFVTNSGIASHGQCDAILKKDPTLAPSDYTAAPTNTLKLGSPTAEYSLETGRAYEVNSYWRLSSNSSGGATVYYSGHTLTNTVGDEITPLDDTGSDVAGGGYKSHPGSEQFGLGIDAGTATSATGGLHNIYNVDSDTTIGYGTAADTFGKYVTDDTSLKSHLPQLYPLVPKTNYGNAAGTTSGQPSATTGFAFNKNSDTYAIPLATETTDVVDCVTAKMRYVANIAATTPAGIYTTKVNYIASPQY